MKSCLFVKVAIRMPKKVESGETAASVPPRRNISEIKNKLRRAEAFRQMKRDQKKVVSEALIIARVLFGILKFR